MKDKNRIIDPSITIMGLWRQLVMTTEYTSQALFPSMELPTIKMDPRIAAYAN